MKKIALMTLILMTSLSAFAQKKLYASCEESAIDGINIFIDNSDNTASIKARKGSALDMTYHSVEIVGPITDDLVQIRYTTELGDRFQLEIFREDESRSAGAYTYEVKEDGSTGVAGGSMICDIK